MLNPSSIAFLKRLLDTPGPSGYEAAAGRVWREEASRFTKHVSTDVAGNCMAEVNPGGSPTIMLDGHLDEIGLIVQYIDDDGFIYISPIGGWDPQVLVGQRIRFLGRGGDVVGVVGKKPIHLMKNSDREHASKMTDLWVDIGAANRAEVEQRLSIGDAGVIDSKSVDFPNGRLVSRSIDNRIGAFVVLEALRRYAENPGPARVVAAATVQEEIAWHGGGALVCAHCINPQMAIVVDVTFATDHPNLEKKELGEHKMGSRPGDQSRRADLAGRCSICPRHGTVEEDSVSRYTRSAATRRRTPTRFTSPVKASRRRSSRFRIATCTRLTR